MHSNFDQGFLHAAGIAEDEPRDMNAQMALDLRMARARATAAEEWMRGQYDRAEQEKRMRLSAERCRDWAMGIAATGWSLFWLMLFTWWRF